jgi:hypothetical protein
VVPFLASLGVADQVPIVMAMVDQVPIVMAMVAYDDPITAQTYMIVIHQALYFGD